MGYVSTDSYSRILSTNCRRETETRQRRESIGDGLRVIAAGRTGVVLATLHNIL